MIEAQLNWANPVKLFISEWEIPSQISPVMLGCKGPYISCMNSNT